jgi:hypothetical protein
MYRNSIDHYEKKANDLRKILEKEEALAKAGPQIDKATDGKSEEMQAENNVKQSETKIEENQTETIHGNYDYE